MDKDIAALINMPWATLLALASGYAGYFVANAGIRAHHKTIEIAFSTIVFGFFGSFAFEYLNRSGWGMLSASLAAFVAAVLCGALWSRVGRRAFEWGLREARVSHSDELPSAWKALFASTSTTAHQLTVKLTDGTWIHCNNLKTFDDEPNGPCTLGDSGDVLMYVTHRATADPASDFEEVPDLTDAEYGTEITYIPKDKIERLILRRKRR